jgi:hypothetical protein
MERPKDLEPSQDALRAIELATSRLRVEVAADQHRLAPGVPPIAAQSHVAQPVGRDREPDVRPPLRQKATGLTIECREGRAVVATLRCRPDGGHFHQAVPEPFGGERQVR